MHTCNDGHAYCTCIAINILQCMQMYILKVHVHVNAGSIIIQCNAITHKSNIYCITIMLCNICNSMGVIALHITITWHLCVQVYSATHNA